MNSEDRFDFDDEDPNEEREILDDLESIKDLLDDESQPVAADAGESSDAADEPPVPILDDLVDGALTVAETGFEGGGPAADLTTGATRMDESVYEALLGEAWKADATGLLTAARGAIEAHRNDWTPEDTDELNEALRIRIDDTLRVWLRKAVAERIDELRGELLKAAEATISEQIAKLDKADEEHGAAEDHG